jgi:hypothetical protein
MLLPAGNAFRNIFEESKKKYLPFEHFFLTNVVFLSESYTMHFTDP